MHEAQLYAHNCFVTLTFDDEHLPEDFSINVRDWQLFMKKLRFAYSGKKIRFYSCGEYGDQNLRPHYHGLLFNHDFADREFYKKTPTGDSLYTSKALSKIWPQGLAILGDVTFESAAYVARYVMKKQTGEHASWHYLREHPLTKLYHFVRPEFQLCSRRPGLGAPWLERFKADTYPDDFVLSRGRKMKPPRFYDSKLTEEELEALKRRRKKSGLRQKEHQTPERLRVRATVRDAKISQLKRTV